MKRHRPNKKDNRITKVPNISASDAKRSDDQEIKTTASIQGKTSSIGLFAAKELSIQGFLLSVARGKRKEAEEMLNIRDGAARSKLLLSVAEFTDYSGRTFRCTAYQYAYWAKDTKMCSMLEKYMDADTKSSILKLIMEMERIDESTSKVIGLTYQQYNETHNSAHFDFSPLIQALETYMTCVLTSNVIENDCNWMEVGQAQRDVPAHVAQEYCGRDSDSYYNRNTLQVLTFQNEITGQKDSWFPLNDNSGLGFTFAVLGLTKGAIAVGGESRWKHEGDWLDYFQRHHTMGRPDWERMRRLDDERTLELKQLRENLDPTISQYRQCSVM